VLDFEPNHKDVHSNSLPARLEARRESVTFELVFTGVAVYRVHSMDASAAQRHNVGVGTRDGMQGQGK
jgi:hypothetical protein